MLVGAIMNTNVVTVTGDHTVLKAARLMQSKRVGTVVVVDEAGRPAGLVTDRDVTVKAVAGELDMQTPVDEINRIQVPGVGDTLDHHESFLDLRGSAVTCSCGSAPCMSSRCSSSVRTDST